MSSVPQSSDLEPTLLQSVQNLQIPSFVLVPFCLLCAGWILFLFLWLQLDRPDKLGGYQDQKDYTFPRTGVTQPSYMAKEKTSQIAIFQLSFMLLAWMFSMDVDRSESGIAFYFFSAVFLLVVLTFFGSALYSFVALRNDYVMWYNLFALWTLAASYCLGIFNYYAHIGPAMAQAQGRYYTHVQPINEAVAYKDAGALEFGPTASVDEAQTLGYKIAGTVYCVAPIVNPNFANTLQFFAVGTDCCEHQLTFKCGTFAKVSANEGPVIAGYVLADRVPADEDGFFKFLALDLYKYVSHNSKLWSAIDIYREGAKGIGQTMGRSVSSDALFVDLFETPVTNHESYYGVQSKADGKWLSNALTMEDAEHAQWYVTKGIGRWYNIMTKVSGSEWQYLGAFAGALVLSPVDSGLGTERWELSFDGQLRLVTGSEGSDRQRYLNADLSLTTEAATPSPEWVLHPQASENGEQWAPWLNGPLNFFGSGSGFVVWALGCVLYLLSLTVFFAFLRPAPKSQPAPGLFVAAA